MAFHHGRGKGYSPEPYHFFKVILESTIRDGKLISDYHSQRIPSKFARDYGNTLSRSVFFEFPNGEVWELELTKLEDELWVQNGWRKIVEHYSLVLGYFLVFRYQGNRRFHVLIFDRSASEIHYPYATGEEGIHQQQVKMEESEEDDSVQIINNFSTGMRKKLVMQCPRPIKITRASNNVFSAGKREVKQVKSYEKFKALMRARCAFKSENPFFLVFMQPTYVDVGSDSKRSCHVCIPRKFSRKYLMDHGDVILSDSNGKTWSAEYRCIQSTKGSYVKLCNGWGDFVRDNKLQVGDVCIFELIDCIDIAIRVFIYSGNHGLPTKMDAGISPAQQECLEPMKALEALELQSEESPEVDDYQPGTSRPQTRVDGLNSEKKEYNTDPESNTLLFSKNKTMFEKGESTKISLDVISMHERPRVGSKLPVIALSSLSPPSSSLYCSSRLQNTTPVTYSEAALVNGDKLSEDVELMLSKSEVYTEEHENLLDNTKTSWTLSFDGCGSDGRWIYDSFKEKTYHQYRSGHGEHVLEANEKPNWTHPACHGICNCSLCWQAKGWAPPVPLNVKISKMDFNLVSHDLIQSLRAYTDMEKNPDNTDEVSAKRSLSFPAPALPSEDSREMDDNQLVTSKSQTGEDSFNCERKEYNTYPESNTLLFSKNETVFEKGEPTEINLDVHGDKIDDGKELNFSNKETDGSPVTLENIPKRKDACTIEPSADSIARRLRQRRRKDTSHHETTGLNGEVLDGSSKNVEEGCTAEDTSPKLMKRPASGMENGLHGNPAMPKQSHELGNGHDKPGSPGANDSTSGETAENMSSRKKSRTSIKHSTSGTNLDCIARRLRPRSKAL